MLEAEADVVGCTSIAVMFLVMLGQSLCSRKYFAWTLGADMNVDDLASVCVREMDVVGVGVFDVGDEVALGGDVLAFAPFAMGTARERAL